MKKMPTTAFLQLAALLAIIGIGCNRSEQSRAQGYAEGEFVYVASPLAGELERLHVQRGTAVKAGEPLFELESESEKAAREEAERRVTQARAELEDAKKGQRPTEIASMEAQLYQARAALDFSEKEYTRQENLFESNVIPAQDLDRARAARDQDRQRVAQLEAELETARLGARADRVAAAEANVHAIEAALAQAAWNLSQKRQYAQQDGLVYDTLYRKGEWIAAGRPVVVLLPPGNIKVRAFVPERQVGRLRLGETAHVYLDGRNEAISGRVSFVSPRAEFTPPVIYSRESRQKLVFMIEITFDAEVAAGLHPGQPVDVQFE